MEGSRVMIIRLAFLVATVTSQAVAQQADDLAIGQTVARGQGEVYTRDVSGDWEVRRERADQGQRENCSVYQLLRQPDGNPIAEISLFPINPGGQAVAGATIVTPLETLLQRGIQITVDGAETKVYPYSFCTRVGCTARVGFTRADLLAFERGRIAVMEIFAVANSDRSVQIPISLNGFTVGYDALLD